MPVASRFADATNERAQAEKLALCDASALPRTTLKGPGAADVLRGVDVPAAIFGVTVFDHGGLVARTGAAELFVEDGPGGGTVASLTSALDHGPAGVYEVPRQDASLLLSGTQAAEVLLETCGYDFRQPAGQLVMTRVAGVSCAVLARRLNGIRAFQLWLDGTYGVYLWETLLEIVREARGDVVGLAVFYPELAN